MNVADIMTPGEEVITVELPGTRDDVLEYLQDRAFSSVPVLKQTSDGHVYHGLVSRRTLIEHADEDQLAMLSETVTTISREASLAEAIELMTEAHERRLPVVEDDRLEGIITVTDAVRAIARGDIGVNTNTNISVEAVAGQEVNCVYAETPLPVGEQQLSFAGVPYAVVLDEAAKPTGMLTEEDVIAVARVVEGEDDTGESIANQDSEWSWEGIKAVGNSYLPTRNVEIPASPVAEFMTPELVTVGTHRTVRAAAQLLIQHKIEQLPMVSADHLEGIVQDMHLLEAVR
ncbi:MAG: CBS domain containing membrane protein [halophilic archaeon J07HX5]|nr:MAG: CBS domain containing membrane protein [halophilic archaeon J07HX5]